MGRSGDEDIECSHVNRSGMSGTECFVLSTSSKRYGVSESVSTRLDTSETRLGLKHLRPLLRVVRGYDAAFV
jgi:hypothetical protein